MTDAAGQPIINIVGEQVMLGPLRRDLLPLYQGWLNDYALQRTLGDLPAPLMHEQIEAQYDRDWFPENQVRFLIYKRAGMRPIGMTLFHSIDHRNRTADFVIFIGDSRSRGRGYGTEATQLMLDYAFTALGLHSVLLTVYEFNLAGRRAYEKAGFREIGRRRQCFWMGGTLWDEIYMDCLATDFTSPVLGRVFVPNQP